MRVFTARFGVAIAILAACLSLEGATLSPQQAESFERKVGQIRDSPRPRAVPRRTPLSQDEINSWFTYRAQPVLPSGLTSPQVTIIGDGRLSGQAVLDFDAIGRRRSTGGWLDPWALLGGRLPLTATGTLQARDGQGRFVLETATLGGVPIPKAVLQELLSLYSRREERPRGVNLDDPFPLPADIRSIEFGRGQAVVVQ